MINLQSQLTNKVRQKRLHSLDTLRGFAVFFVCWFHFTNSNSDFLLNDSLLRLSGKYGYIGIDIFFVISGFILTHVLLRSDYDLKTLPRFIAHRLMRLEPPYIASIIIIIILNYMSEMSIYYKGDDVVFDIGQILSHIGYLSGVLEIKWLNPVYWTLGVELQFYLLIGVLFPFLIASRSRVVPLIVLLSILGFTNIGDPWILKYLPIFSIGIVACFYYNNIITITALLIAFLFLMVILVFNGEFLSVVVSFLTILLINCKVLSHVKLFSYLGTISYSLYLLHIPIGMRVINIGQRISHSENIFFNILILFIALLLSIMAANLLYRLVERPAINWAKKTAYRK